MNTKTTPYQQLISDFYAQARDTYSTEERAYIDFHRYRYALILEVISSFLRGREGEFRALDVGPYLQTPLLRGVLPNLAVDTLGFNHHLNILRSGEQHYHQDLNTADEQWVSSESKYDLILFCEVMEHLYAPPEFVLERFYAMLRPGGLLLIQTPNAVAIHKRVRMLLGQNPYERLQASRAGHFREYTGTELRTMGTTIGFTVASCTYHNYFNSPKSSVHQWFRRLEAIVPSQLRDGITLLLRK